MSIAEMKALVDAVKSEAERDRERILNHASSEARSISERASAEAASEQQIILQKAEDQAALLLVEARATAQLEAQSMKLEKREAMINHVFDRAEERLAGLHQSEDYQVAVYALIEDAVTRMENVHSLVVDADAVTMEFLDQDVLIKLGNDWGCRLLLGDVLKERNGVIVRSHDGRFIYDNTFQARLTRLKPELRSPVFQTLRGHGL